MSEREGETEREREREKWNFRCCYISIIIHRVPSRPSQAFDAVQVSVVKHFTVVIIGAAVSFFFLFFFF